MTVTRTASADAMPPSSHVVKVKFVLSWDAEEFEDYSVYARGWRLGARDDARCFRVENGAVIDKLHSSGADFYAVKGEAEEAEPTRAMLREMDRYALFQLTINRFVAHEPCARAHNVLGDRSHRGRHHQHREHARVRDRLRRRGDPRHRQ